MINNAIKHHRMMSEGDKDAGEEGFLTRGAVGGFFLDWLFPGLDLAMLA